MSRITHSALDKHLSEMPNLPPVAWENVKFDESLEGGTYLRVAFLPASENYGSLGVNGSVHSRGIYQVGISAPGGQGSGEVETLADQIIEHFRKKTIGAIRTLLPTRTQAAPDNGRIWLAVSIPYFFETFF